MRTALALVSVALVLACTWGYSQHGQLEGIRANEAHCAELLADPTLPDLAPCPAINEAFRQGEAQGKDQAMQFMCEVPRKEFRK